MIKKLSQCSLLYNRLNDTFLFCQEEEVVQVPIGRSSWFLIFDVHKQMWDFYNYKGFYKDFVSHRDEQIPLGLKYNPNHSIYLMFTIPGGSYKPGFYLRFKIYSEKNGQCVEEDSIDVRLTGRDWQDIKEFLYETKNSSSYV